MEKKQKLWMGLGIALPLINFMLYIPCGMYNASLHGMGLSSSMNPTLIEIPSWLKTAFNYRVYNRYATGVLLFLWIMIVFMKLTERRQRIIVSAFVLGVYLLIEIMIRAGYYWMMDYHQEAVTDLFIWATFSLCTLIYFVKQRS